MTEMITGIGKDIFLKVQNIKGLAQLSDYRQSFNSGSRQNREYSKNAF
jgi:hypothetical protein